MDTDADTDIQAYARARSYTHTHTHTHSHTHTTHTHRLEQHRDTMMGARARASGGTSLACKPFLLSDQRRSLQWLRLGPSLSSPSPSAPSPSAFTLLAFCGGRGG